VNNDGIPDYILSSPNSIEIDLIPLNNNALFVVPAIPPDLGGFVYALSAGTPISSSLDPAFVWFDRNSPGGIATIVAAANIGSIGYFRGSTDAYAGVRLETDGNFYYGWLHIQNFGVNWGQISEWAFQSNPNTPIFAGQVPEPSTGALFGFGFAVLVLLNRRIRHL
jgi:hypothetical protein